MGQEQFAAIMPYISADLVGMIARKIYPKMTQSQSCIIQSCMPLLSRRIRKSGNTVRICCICFLSRKKKREKLNFPMCKEEQP